jgi:hypothetical protein
VIIFWHSIFVNLVSQITTYYLFFRYYDNYQMSKDENFVVVSDRALAGSGACINEVLHFGAMEAGVGRRLLAGVACLLKDRNGEPERGE